jgi:hypothetical protein
LLRAVGLAAMATPLFALAAHAQFAASASITNDFRYRGGSIGSDQPALTLNLSYDAPVSGPVGGYIGGAAAIGPLPDAGVQVLSHTEYVGVAGKAFRDSTWDLGISNTFLSFYNGSVYQDYNAEVYAGLKTKFLSYYLHYSPHYFFDGVGALYAEVDASVRPAEHWRVFAHLGALTPFAGGVPYYPTREQYDARIGVVTLIKGAEFGLAWTFQRPGYGPAGPGSAKPDALIVTATTFF